LDVGFPSPDPVLDAGGVERSGGESGAVVGELIGGEIWGAVLASRALCVLGVAGILDLSQSRRAV
jgi:hypothetical protein